MDDNGLQKRKVKIFLIFLACSFMSWFISRLSETYTQNSSFDLVYTNIPDSLMLTNASRNKLDIRVRASGFQLLGFNFRPRKIAIDLSALGHNQSQFYIPQLVYRRQIERQLFESMTLLDVDNDTLFFDFYKVYNKEVPVRAAINLILGQNYLLDGGLKITPAKITIKGPQNQISTVDHVATVKSEITDVTGNFSRKVMLSRPQGLKNTVFSTNSVVISGTVFRFSERLLDIPVEVANLPDGADIRTFPNSIPVLCKGRIENLKNLAITDFKVLADFAKVQENSPYLEVELAKVPKNINSARLMENQVEFILKRE